MAEMETFYRDIELNFSSTLKDRIAQHLQKIKDAQLKVRGYLEAQSENDAAVVVSLGAETYQAIALFRRTKRMMDLYQAYRKENEAIFTLREAFLTTLHELMPMKKFELDSNTQGNLFIFNKEMSNNSGRLLLEDLSSGEKQILTMMIEVLLQGENASIMITDEPEISLHMKWQKILLGSLLRINKNGQYIVATHSPEIAAEWRGKLKKLR